MINQRKTYIDSEFDKGKRVVVLHGSAPRKDGQQDELVAIQAQKLDKFQMPVEVITVKISLDQVDEIIELLQKAKRNEPVFSLVKVKE